jgi:hypothetical protein
MKMTYKRKLTIVLDEMYGVIYHFEKNNQVVIDRWTIQFGYTFDEIISEYNEMVDFYNKKYGKRWGMRNKFKKS